MELSELGEKPRIYVVQKPLKSTDGRGDIKKLVRDFGGEVSSGTIVSSRQPMLHDLDAFEGSDGIVAEVETDTADANTGWLIHEAVDLHMPVLVVARGLGESVLKTVLAAQHKAVDKGVYKNHTELEEIIERFMGVKIRNVLLGRIVAQAMQERQITEPLYQQVRLIPPDFDSLRPLGR